MNYEPFLIGYAAIALMFFLAGLRHNYGAFRWMRLPDSLRLVDYGKVLFFSVTFGALWPVFVIDEIYLSGKR